MSNYIIPLKYSTNSELHRMDRSGDLGNGQPNDKSGIPRPHYETPIHNPALSPMTRVPASSNLNAGAHSYVNDDVIRGTGTSPGNVYMTTGSNPGSSRGTRDYRESYDNSSFVYSNNDLSADFRNKPEKPKSYDLADNRGWGARGKEESSGGCTKKTVIIAMVIVAVILLTAAVVALGVLFALRADKDVEDKDYVDRGIRQSFSGEATLDWTWKPEMADHNSQTYKGTAAIFENEMDKVYTQSNLSDIYISTKVTGLREGSVIVAFDLRFKNLEKRVSDMVLVRQALPDVVTSEFTKLVDQSVLPVGNKISVTDTTHLVETTQKPKDSTPSDKPETCTSHELLCDEKCIPPSKICDGKSECSAGEDESTCVRRIADNVIEVRHRNMWTPVCVQDWNSGLESSVCSALGEGAVNVSSSKTLDTMATSLRFDKKSVNSTFWMSRLYPRDTCESSKVLTLTCLPNYCGKRAPNLPMPMVIGGEKANKGFWPWMASFQISGIHHCGAAIIHPMFVVTAAHCFISYEGMLSHMKIIVGTTVWEYPDSTAKKYNVKRYQIHEKYTLWDDDIALIELTSPIQYDNYIRPICLPSPQDAFNGDSVCYLTGWGRYSLTNLSTSSYLKELSVNIWSREKCNSRDHWNGEVLTTHICAGNTDLTTNGCKGDSGGPLACFNKRTNRWNLVGVASFVSTDCKPQNKPPVFTSVPVEVDWIRENTKCIFKCGNGECIYQKELLCNRKDDCGDNTDETVNCPIDVSCTFEDPFWCGYTLERWFEEKGSFLPYPAFDHTLTNNKGTFLKASGPAKLTSPVFTVTATQCLRFFYHSITYYGNQGQSFFMQLKDVDTDTVTTVWTLQGVAQDRWTMAAVTLNPGKYQIIFYASKNRAASIDDILVTAGKCNEQPAYESCQVGETKCLYEPKPTCLKQVVTCNIAYNCQFASDESNCPANHDYRYSCNFEDNYACGIRRKASRQGNGWQISDSTGRANGLRPATDHTYNTNKGYYFVTKPYDGSEFSIKLWTYEVEYCLTLYYQLVSSLSKLKIQVYDDQTPSPMVLLKEIGEKGVRNKMWHQAQFQIPKGIFITMLVVSVDRYPVDMYDNSFFAIDDISIQPGKCGVFGCPPGTFRCGSSELCIHKSQECDRVQDCPNAEDEKTCKCTPEEFKCHEGMCIEKKLTCDRNLNCPKGDDETATCDKLRTVDCNFEDKFICGYTIQKYDGSEYVWSRHQSNTPTPVTGPNYDHTFANSSGHYMYAEGNRGDKDEYTTLMSPYFTTPATTASIRFFFHIQGDPKHTGYLQLMSRTRETDWKYLAHSELSTVLNPNWQPFCKDIPASTEMKIEWMAIRGAGTKADLAVDDITLSPDACPVTR